MRSQDGTSFWAGTARNEAGEVVTDLGKPGDIIQVTDGGATPELTATF
jgi:hypothetical protein